ncbi:hypothetical protein [Haliea salexigens]|uniref:hypothetical protein n=1 Tax=Haliea salexigens TaxID=287487 RepID=UPI00048282D6|nr:hypothetical protein [Haliea salexigens]
MNAPTPLDTHELCRSFLEEEIRYNQAKGILPSENAVSRNLLAREQEMNELYDEFSSRGWSRQTFEQCLRIVLSIMAHWSPDHLAQAREEKRQLDGTNARIAKVSEELATLLLQREELHNSSGFGSDTHYSIMDLIMDAGREVPSFEGWVKDLLVPIQGQFDLKYWPSIDQVVSALGRNAETAQSYPHDSLTEAGTESARSSISDTVRALIRAIEEQRDLAGSRIPSDFSISDKGFSTLLNCALNLDTDQLKDAGYIKGIRQRLRRAGGVVPQVID